MAGIEPAAGGVRVFRPARENEWRDVERLISELKSWDLAQSRALGLDPDEVAGFFYAGDAGDVRRESGPAGGCMLLAVDADGPAGCAAFRRLSPDACEVLHVYVRPDRRGRGIGSMLLGQLADAAGAAGYRAMRLETATFMRAAHRLYRAHRFQVREPYRSIPARFAEFTISMERTLAR